MEAQVYMERGSVRLKVPSLARYTCAQGICDETLLSAVMRV